ncbi:APC membrane recruitment protein 1 [Lampris incognitus]|uniref:APC membrane recruitment protein 1 n=1 Tax=Lampris incognitus TaxID=2546036 RepID=UPI0024B61E85|nr:APC membrane recruitment protein 1 [Lampris incognitus]
MASCKVDELASDTKHFASGCGQLSASGPDDTAEELQSDMTNAPVKPQASGKFRRTALRFFGVRKSICILPTLFGGRSKSQSKWSSKIGIGKSKTHDGLSKAGQDDNLESEYAMAGNFEYHNHSDTAGKLHNSSHSEFSHAIADQKSLSLSRQKKGLRSLFHSIRHHRNHRNAESDKNEMIAMSSPLCKKKVPVVHDNSSLECLDSLSEPDVPDLADVTCDITIAPECIDAGDVVLESSVVKQERPMSVLDDQTLEDQMEGMKIITTVSSEYDEDSRTHSESCQQLEMTPEPLTESQLRIGSTDQLNLILGDVASLKSFDSLTGCGDIIADQDDDSISDSTVSGERSRNAGKRISCYLTYQGGGEEMASPDDFDGDSLHALWGNKTAEEICCSCDKDHTVALSVELSSSNHMNFTNSNSAHQGEATDISASIADVLTPQSEHQESVPNSDEGYYDSTTPGPDEGQEKVDRIRGDRLPRDSYSGDALYELFAPDESLISPRFEDQPQLPNSESCGYLHEAVDMTDSVFVPEVNQLQMCPNLNQVHQDFLSTEMPTICNKYTRDLHDNDLHQNSNLNSEPQGSLNKTIKLQVFDEKENMLAALENRTKSINTDCVQSPTAFTSRSDPNFDRFSADTFCKVQEQHLEENKPVALSYRTVSTCSAISNDLEDGQTVCFSQALVDYTKHSQLLSNPHNSIDGLENNSSFAQNMQALPTIVTFDVVDMHNEGEYDEQIHMEMEEDITSPYQQFEESYLQKDAFAECDYQLLGLYEQDLSSNAWAIASLPRHLGLTRVNQPMASQLSLDRRSRSLDTEGLELKMFDKHRRERVNVASSPQIEKCSKRVSSLHHQNNVHSSTPEVSDSSSVMCSSMQKKTEESLNPPLTGVKLTGKMHTACPTHIKQTVFSGPSSSNFLSSKPQLPSNGSERVSCEFISQNTELCDRQCHESDSCLSHGTFVFSGVMGGELLVRTVPPSNEDIFYTTTINTQPYSQCSKNRPLTVAQGMSHSGSSQNTNGS